ncbi:MAG: hypothetical protein KF746_24275 [Chitinophagaceae bacterium]|nr:hypothetical protein [Chitinophagaceae bacterium]
MYKFISIAFFILFLMPGCKKANIDTEDLPPVNETPAITETGTPAGAAIVKEIGAGGGKLSSADGKIDVIIPSGAVNVNTQFSIQPITNECPNGRNAFRLMPSGMVFAMPVTIIFHYTDKDIEGSLPELLAVAYQDINQIWYRIPSADIDTIAKTISVKAKHFTDWSDLEGLKLKASSEGKETGEVKISKQLLLEVSGTNDAKPLPPAPDNPSPEDDELPPLPLPSPKKPEWYVNRYKKGNATVGTVSPAPDDLGTYFKYMAIYTAPDKVPSPSTVTVNAELTGLNWKAKVHGRMIRFEKVILSKPINIIGNEYDYTVEIAYNDNNITGYTGQLYTDKASFNMHVKLEDENAVVALSEIKNYDASVTPEVKTYNLPGSSITFTWLHGGGISNAGFMNITGTQVSHYSESDTLLNLALLHKDPINVKFEYKSVVGGGSQTGIIGGEPMSNGIPGDILMKVVNREQIFRQENGMGIFIKITPVKK